MQSPGAFLLTVDIRLGTPLTHRHVDCRLAALGVASRCSPVDPSRAARVEDDHLRCVERIGAIIGGAIFVCAARVWGLAVLVSTQANIETFVRSTPDSMTAFTTFPTTDFRHTGIDQLAGVQAVQLNSVGEDVRPWSSIDCPFAVDRGAQLSIDDSGAYRAITACALDVEPRNRSFLVKRTRYNIGAGDGAGGCTP